jgi:hypothetical protein
MDFCRKTPTVPATQQQLNDLQMPVLSSGEQCSGARIRLDHVRVCTRRQQDPHCIRLAVARCTVQRGFTVRSLASVGISAIREQHLHNLHMPLGCWGEEWGLAFSV